MGSFSSSVVFQLSRTNSSGKIPVHSPWPLGCGSLGFLWLPKEVISEDNRRIPLLPGPSPHTHRTGQSLGIPGDPSTEPREGLALPLFCSFPGNSGGRGVWGKEAREPRKRLGSPGILPCEAPLSWPQLPGWPPSPLRIHEQASGPF